MPNISPEYLLEKLKQGASPKVQDTLDAIFRICNEQVKQNLYDFSIATISRLGHQKGVPKAQSIRNSSGKKYHKLITFFCRQQH